MKSPRILALFTVLLLACVALWAQGAKDVPQGTRFSFVQITDTHFGEGDNFARAQKVITAINKLPMEIACVVHTGDITTNLTDDPTVVAQSQQLFNQLKVPVHFVAGNHDILPGERLPAMVKAFQQNFGPLASKAEYHGVVFLMVDTEPLVGSYAIEGYDPLTWLAQQIKAANGKPVIIFHHGAAVEDFYNNSLHDYWSPAVKERWERIVTAPNVKAIICGHFHRDEMHFIGNVPVFVSPPVAGYWGRQATFRIYEYNDGQISYRTVYPE